MAAGSKRGRKAPPRTRRSRRAPQRTSTEQLELVTRAINEGVYDWDIARGTIYYSEAVYTAIHMPRSVKTPEGWRRRIHPEDLPAYDAAIVAHFKRRTRRFECDYRYRDRNGAWRWARQHGVAVRDPRGRAIRMVGSTGDITEFKRIEQALADSEARYSLATQAATEGIYDFDIETGSLFLSDRAREFFAFAGKRLTPKAWNARVHKEDYPAYREAVIRCLKGHSPRLEHEYRVKDASGGWKWIFDRGIAVRDLGDRATRLVGAVSDITRRKDAELALRQARDEATAALERQTATAGILRAIAESPTDSQPVLEALATRAGQLCGAAYVNVLLEEGGKLRTRAVFSAPGGPKPDLGFTMPASRFTVNGRAFLERRVVHVEDFAAVAKKEYPEAQDFHRRFRFRSILGIPMLREGIAIGTLSVWRLEVKPFAADEIALLQTFADQAVIAIENARLFNETKEALEQQRASAEVLVAISGSMSDTQPVFDRILESCERLFAGRLVGINVLGADGKLHLGAYRGEGRERFERIFPLPADEGSGSGAAMLRGEVVHYPDVDGDESVPPATRAGCAALGVKSVIFAPMLSEEGGIGAIFVGRRFAVAFSDKEIELLKSFANQAAISIKNVRLFNETREALERQTATAEILQVISGSLTDTQPVFDAIVRSGMALFSGAGVGIGTVNGDEVVIQAAVGMGGSGKGFRMPLSRESASGLAILEHKVVNIPDTEAPGVPPHARENGRRLNIRSMTQAPMFREGEPIGSIGVMLKEPGGLDDKQVSLLKTFADQAVIAIENVRLFNETKEALERQTATAEILKVIAASPSDVQPVFDAILENASRLCESQLAAAFRYDGTLLHLVATKNWPADALANVASRFPMPPDPKMTSGRAALTGEVVCLEDTLADSGYDHSTAHAGGWRRMIGVPMLRDGAPIGVIVVTWLEPGPIPERLVALLKTFADQAVIAIENVRLFNETREALERQTATAEILKVIASSPSDVQPVFDTIVKSALSLCRGLYANVFRYDGELLHFMATESLVPRGVELLRAKYPMRPDASQASGRVISSGAVVRIDDVSRDPDYDPRLVVTGGPRRMLAVPMMREGAPIGVVVVAWGEPGSIVKHHEELLQTFADQAVIAIENVRLFNETKEALERQTATAEILKVIAGSPTDVQPVFDAIATSAKHLLGGLNAVVTRMVGDEQHLAAFTTSSEEGDAALRGLFPTQARDLNSGRAIATLAHAIRTDTETDPDISPAARESARARGYRSVLAVPMIRDGVAIGSISVSRANPGPFLAHQIGLLETFADQAVIAIENVRLFNETKEALEQQTATAEILKVISESPTDTQPVFEAIVQAGLRLFPDSTVLLTIPGGARVHAVAVAHRDPAVAAATWNRFPIALSRDRLHGAAILEGTLIDFPDVEGETEGRFAPGARNFLASGNRAITIAPMMCGDAAIGAISVARETTGPLGEKQVALLRTFAAQAVIAVENVRVFKELEARTGALTRSVEQLTALGEVGQAISSTLDLETVLKTIVQRAVQLTGLDGGAIYEYDERSEEFHVRATENLSDELVQVLRETPARKGEGVIGSAVETGQPTEIPEMLDDSYQSPRRDSLIKAGYRALLVVPLLREEHIIGALTVNRRAPGMFSHDVVELLKTFATQSALAIQNARLFREIAEKGKQLEVASRHKSDFLASMSHELRTPLNAILGFNEMILGQVYGDVPADMREPLEDIQKSGKHLLRLINNVLDLAKIEAGRMELSLQDYSVHDTVESVRATLRPLAAEKGLEFLVAVPAELPLAYGDSGRIAQCLMNLAGNSLKFTKAGKVEIAVAERDALLTFRVADTGIGIARDKIGSLFTEFKQTDATIASEYGGTGLGLSISKKFVEMHGGRIWIESEPGKGSVFIFEIPLRVKA